MGYVETSMKASARTSTAYIGISASFVSRIIQPIRVRRPQITPIKHHWAIESRRQAAIDPLRDLVTQYVAHEQTQIAGSEPCLSWVEKSGPCARDLLSMA